MAALGAIHVVFGLCALLTGAVVVLIRKRTRYHRTIGHWYFASMLGLNVTGLLIYRVTGWPLGAAVGLTTTIVVFVGVYFMLRRTPLALERLRPRQHVRKKDSPG